MAQTWRERIVAARERGGFSDAEREMAAVYRTCAVGEMSAATGLSWADLDAWVDWKVVGFWSPASGRFTNAVRTNQFESAEEVLDAIEDRALVLKREALGASVSEATPSTR
jgi:hypothetical protein